MIGEWEQRRGQVIPARQALLSESVTPRNMGHCQHWRQHVEQMTGHLSTIRHRCFDTKSLQWRLDCRWQQRRGNRDWNRRERRENQLARR